MTVQSMMWQANYGTRLEWHRSNLFQLVPALFLAAVCWRSHPSAAWLLTVRPFASSTTYGLALMPRVMRVESLSNLRATLNRF